MTDTPTPIRVSLDENDFRALVFGGIARPIQRNVSEPIEIVLQDIGWAMMKRAILEAEERT